MCISENTEYTVFLVARKVVLYSGYILVYFRTSMIGPCIRVYCQCILNVFCTCICTCIVTYFFLYLGVFRCILDVFRVYLSEYIFFKLCRYILYVFDVYI